MLGPEGVSLIESEPLVLVRLAVLGRADWAGQLCQLGLEFEIKVLGLGWAGRLGRLGWAGWAGP